MLTPAQRKLRQELEELQATGRYFNKKEPLPVKRKRPRFNWGCLVIAVLAVLITCVTVAIKLNHHSAI